MNYTENGDSVTLHMKQYDFSRLLVALGYAVGAANRSGDPDLSASFVKLVNDMNAGNPHFTPYEILSESERLQKGK